MMLPGAGHTQHILTHTHTHAHAHAHAHTTLYVHLINIVADFRLGSAL